MSRALEILYGKVRECRGPVGTRIVIVRRLIPGWAGAQTWGNTIFVLQGQSLAQHLPHELVHVEQWRRLGLLFPLAYLLAGLVALPRPYRDNRFEVEARRRAAEFEPVVRRWLRRGGCAGY